MKLTINRPTLRRALQVVAPAVKVTSRRAVLGSVRAEALGDRLTLAGTDTEIALAFSAEAEVLEGGAALLPFEALRRLVGTAPDGSLSIDADDACVQVGADNGKFQMPTSPVEEFPNPFPGEPGAGVELEAPTLRRMLRSVTFAAGKENGRYAVTAIQWEAVTNGLTLVATDAQRLAIAGPTHVGALDRATALVPAKALKVLERLLAVPGASARLVLRKHDALFRLGAATLYTRLVEGDFPPYRDILPRKPVATVPLVLGPFLAAIRHAAVMTTGESRRLTFAFAPGKLTLTAHGAAHGRSQVELPLEWTGQPAAIHLDPSYVSDLSKALPADAPITVDLTAPDRPALFRHGTAFRYLVMPFS